MKPNPELSSSTPSSTSSSIQGKQLELQISGSTPGTCTDRVDDDSARQDRKPSIKQWAAPFALVTVLLITLIFTSSMANKNLAGVNRVSEQFRSSDTEISALDVWAPERLYLPPIDLPSEGPVIQVGIFTKLTGAEKKLIALTNLGLDPHVQKRVTDNGLKYAVLLGPLSASTHHETLLTLKKYNYPYFHRPESGS